MAKITLTAEEEKYGKIGGDQKTLSWGSVRRLAQEEANKRGENVYIVLSNGNVVETIPPSTTGVQNFGEEIERPRAKEEEAKRDERRAKKDPDGDVNTDPYAPYDASKFDKEADKDGSSIVPGQDNEVVNVIEKPDLRPSGARGDAKRISDERTDVADLNKVKTVDGKFESKPKDKPEAKAEPKGKDEPFGPSKK